MKSSNFLSNVGGCLLYLYGIISQIMTIVFFIGYSRTDSILEIIFIDGIISEAKGLLWIFFIW